MNEAMASGGARSFTGQPASHRYQLWSLSSASGAAGWALRKRTEPE